RMDLAGIDAALAGGAGLVLLCNPQNPLGCVFEADELRALAEVVERHGARVFSDEIHAPLVYPGARHVPYASVSDAAARHCVVAGNDRDLDRGRRIAVVAGHGVAGLGMIAATAAWREGGAWLDGVLRYLDGNRQRVSRWMATHLPEARFVAPQGTYLAWLDCRALPLPAGTTAAALFRRRARVALTDGRECGEAGAGHVRLNFAMPRPVLDEALSRMADAIATLRGGA